MSIYPSGSMSQYGRVWQQPTSYGNSYSGISSNCYDGDDSGSNYFQNFNSGCGNDSFDSPTTQLIAPGESSRVWGDPHIDDADGGKYDFQQRGNYNLLEDTGVTLNGKLDGKEGGPSYMKEAGLVVNGRKVRIGSDGKVMINKGQDGQDVELKDGETRQLGNGSYITKNGDTVNVGTPEYSMEFKTNQGSGDDKYMDAKVSTKDGGVGLDGRQPTGLLGETFDSGKDAQTKPNQDPDNYKRCNLFETGQPQSGQQLPDDAFPSSQGGYPSQGQYPGCGSSGDNPFQNYCGQQQPQNYCGGNSQQQQAMMANFMRQWQQFMQQMQQYFGSSCSPSYGDNSQGSF